MNKLLKSIPNVLTSLNLAFGFFAIAFALNTNTLYTAPFLIFIAAIFDFCDGFAARIFKAQSEFGKQLDSLADVVSFGVAPGILVYQLFSLMSVRLIIVNHFPLVIIMALSALIPVFSALRLAKFNLDERQTDHFIGLPTPASAIFFASLIVIVFKTDNLLVQNIILHQYTILFLVLIISFLMVSEIPMFSMKFKNLSIKDNLTKYVFILISITLIIFFKIMALPLIIGIYVVMSTVIFLSKKMIS
jgi:CDP-diacylglycerol--serine O-phosphatidyltransferase